MTWRNRASCLNIPTNIFFPGTDKQTDKRYWDTHTMCRECPVNVDCLADALNNNYEIGLFCMPERVRRRFKAKPPQNLFITMRETFTTLDIIAAEFNKDGSLLRKRCLRCNRKSKGFPKDFQNWGGRSHICVSCHIAISNNKQADKLLDREKPSKALPEFDSHGQLITKKCTKCWERKEADQFSKRPQGIGGKTSWCKACTRKNLEQWVARQKDVK
jgi:hypothetical protein|tara:strand:+ start:15 stop:662 length:648 start_codon:yes stop_codon:yes gene_type:complete